MSTSKLLKSLTKDFEKKLFEKSPTEKSQKLDPKLKGEIVKLCKKKFAEFISSDKLKQSRSFGVLSNGNSFLVSITTDRAFIIDSTVEYFKSKDIEINQLLHPIFSDNKKGKVSFNFIEFNHQFSKAEEKKIAKDLDDIFYDLFLVTDDFQKMSDLAHTVREEIEDRETKNFLRWMESGGLIFFGSRTWKGKGEKKSDLGIFKSRKKETQNKLSTLDELRKKLSNQVWKSTRCPILSKVHRRGFYISFCIKHGTKDQPLTTCFCGLFTNKAIREHAQFIPHIGKISSQAIEPFNAIANSHEYKELLDIIDIFPKSDLLELKFQDISDIVSRIRNSIYKQETTSFFWTDELKNFLSIMVVMPREKFGEELGNKILSELVPLLKLEGEEYDLLYSFSDQGIARIFFRFTNSRNLPISKLVKDPQKLDDLIKEWSLSWEDKFKILTADRKELEAVTPSFFSNQYKAHNTPSTAIKDSEYICPLISEEELNLELDFNEIDPKNGDYELRVFKKNGGITLSALLPILENLGFDVISQTKYFLNDESTEIRLYVLSLRLSSHYVSSSSSKPVFDQAVKERVNHCIKECLNKKLENDRLLQLVLKSEISHKFLPVIRLFKSYLAQTHICTSYNLFDITFTKNLALAECFIDYFETKFNPNIKLSTKKREEELKNIEKQFKKLLGKVSGITEDQILRSSIEILKASVRTNYYSNEFLDQPVSIKINAQSAPCIPEPRPLFEIFIRSPYFEGVHLRFGRVSRGGLRASDRVEDFRTEILGLMDTQVVKNSMIVPDGAKGGFVLRHFPFGAPNPYSTEDIYKLFIRSLLTITDNYTNSGKEIRANDCICHDDFDPYLVVAADKGTATFSDVANSIACDEFDFWLGDAFASGGSNGYDHKKYGITAKGAWEAVKRHFKEINIDVDTQPFTVSGVGDMSGDVFGNGMLLSNQIKLVAAFNHRHIFIDPNPDVSTSFKERKRLFNLGRSSWSDYNKKLISKGGGIYERDAKNIKLSPEAKIALGTTQSVFSGDELINTILKAPVDLLWNGGIGTYVKSQTEANVDVGDKSNDSVRINATELKAKVVGEGGNLGMTLKSRVEAAISNGTLVNADFIDNAGGVSMSDYEVNLKILLDKLVAKGSIKQKDRNKLLHDLGQITTDYVLSACKEQCDGISLSMLRKKKFHHFYEDSIRSLKKSEMKRLSKWLDFLPSGKDLEMRRVNGGLADQTGSLLTKTELSTSLSLSKIDYCETITNSLRQKPSLLNFSLLKEQTLSYFPDKIQSKYKNQILNHPLRQEITATKISNSVVNLMGAGFVNRICSETISSQIETTVAYLMAHEILEADRLKEVFKKMDKAGKSSQYLYFFLRLSIALERVTKWILQNLEIKELLDKDNFKEIDALVIKFKKEYKVLVSKTTKIVHDEELNVYNGLFTKLLDAGLDNNDANDLASSIYASSYLDIIKIAKAQKADVIKVAKVYSQVATMLHFSNILDMLSEVNSSNRWDAISKDEIFHSLRLKVARITKKIVSEIGLDTKRNGSLNSVDKFFSRNQMTLNNFNSTYRLAQESDARTISSMYVLNRQIEALISNY